MTFLPTMSNPARSAIIRTSCNSRPAVNTSFRELRRSIDRFSMNRFMAGMTNCDSIIYLSSEFRKIREWLDMMCLKEFSPISAHLTGIVITLKDRLTPFSKLITYNRSLTMEAYTTFPVGRFVTTIMNRAVFTGTIARAELCPPICGGEGLTTPLALLNRGGVAVRPALLRAVFRCISTVIKSLKGFTTNNAYAGHFPPFHDNTAAYQDIKHYHCEVKVNLKLNGLNTWQSRTQR